MKKVMLMAVGVSCLLVGMAVPASAQSGKPLVLKGEVPFAFVSGDRTLGAGTYSIEIGQSRVRILDANSHPVQVIVSNPQQDNGSEEKPRLLFHRYGDTYFLWQIWTREHKVDFRMSRTEYDLKASRKADEGTIILAMR
jgi:hypothetical protein